MAHQYLGFGSVQLFPEIGFDPFDEVFRLADVYNCVGRIAHYIDAGLIRQIIGRFKFG